MPTAVVKGMRPKPPVLRPIDWPWFCSTPTTVNSSPSTLTFRPTTSVVSNSSVATSAPNTITLLRFSRSTALRLRPASSLRLRTPR